MNHKVIDFIRKGEVAGVGLETDRHSVIVTLGHPEHWEGFEDVPLDKSGIWIYGVLCINFENEAVSAVTLNFGECSGSSLDAQGPLGFALDPKQLEFGRFKEALDNECIRYTEDTDFLSRPLLRLSKTAYVSFCLDKPTHQMHVLQIRFSLPNAKNPYLNSQSQSRRRFEK